MPATKPIRENRCPSVDQTTSMISENPRQSEPALSGVEGAKRRRGGRRPGAGAPKGNMNALKHGGYSRQFAQLGALVAASPAACQALLRLIQRQQDRHRKADEIAAYILSQVIARGLKKGRDRLILLPPVEKEDSISQNTGFDEEKTGFHPRDNHSSDTKTEGQSEIR